MLINKFTRPRWPLYRLRYALFLALSLFCSTLSAADFYWVGDSGNWSDFANHWATTSGGSTFWSQVPSSADNVIFDANSFTTTGQTVYINVDAYCYDFRTTGISNSPTIQNSGPSQRLRVYGSMTLDPNMTWNYQRVVVFDAVALGNTITMSGHRFSQGCAFTGNGGWVLQDPFWSDRYMNLISGDLNTNNQPLRLDYFVSASTNVRNLDFTNSVLTMEGA